MATALVGSKPDVPLIILSDTFPKTPPIYEMRVRLRLGHIYFTKGLVDLLNFPDNKPAAVALIQIGESFYLTRSEKKNALYVRATAKTKSGDTQGSFITSRPTVTHIKEVFDLSGKDVVNLPVAAKLVVDPVSLGLKPADYPFPIYRVQTDFVRIEHKATASAAPATKSK